MAKCSVVMATALAVMLYAVQVFGAAGGEPANTQTKANETTINQASVGNETAEELILTPGPLTAEYKTKDTDTEWDDDAVTVTCGDSVVILGEGVTSENGVITVSSAGTYVLSGAYSGQILINADDTDYVHLVFNGFKVNNQNGPAVYAVSCDKLTITLADGSENSITDGTGYTFAEGQDEPDAALFSEADMSLNGNGTLSVTGNYADAIKCKKDLKFISGTYEINAVSEGIKGRNSVVIKDGTFRITSGETGIKSTRDNSAEKGYVIIDGGDITISAVNDGIHAETHTTINGGIINITDSYEGIEGQMIDITGGIINVTASDDGINASKIGSTSNKGGGKGDMTAPDGTWTKPGREQWNNENGGMPGGMQRGAGQSNEQVYINISGGTVTVSGNADCIDSNGNLTLSGGTVYSSSPRSGITGNEAVFDTDGMFSIKSGCNIVATGTSSANSAITNEQNSFYIYEAEQHQAGTRISLKNSSGTEIIGYTPEYSYQGIMITSPQLTLGETYTLTIGDSMTEITLSEQNTTIGTPTQGGMFGGGGRGKERMQFSDVSDTDSYYNAVSFLSRMGAMNGTEESVFSPGQTLTRAMAVTVLGRLSNAAQTYGNDPSAVFGDVDNNDYYAPYVGWATEKGIVEGYGETASADYLALCKDGRHRLQL